MTTTVFPVTNGFFFKLSHGFTAYVNLMTKYGDNISRLYSSGQQSGGENVLAAQQEDQIITVDVSGRKLFLHSVLSGYGMGH